MDIDLYGGNRVGSPNLGRPGLQILGSGPYQYYLYETLENERITFGELRSFTLFVLENLNAATVTVQGISEKLLCGDRVQSEGFVLKVNVEGGPVKFLVAGTSSPHPSQKGLFFCNHANLYKVDKPWGHELWINGQHPCYALKQIYLKAGSRTSLQYHNFKQETNVLFEGRANLYYKDNHLVKNDDVTSSDLRKLELNPISSIDVNPGILHRLEAITDILLYETSTPHLDDVVRVTDDSRRPDGRIEREHVR
jgi:mannose-6-phosphate isomerase